MTTLETLLKQVEELDTEWNQSPPSTNYERMATVETRLAQRAPILVAVIHKLVETVKVSCISKYLCEVSEPCRYCKTIDDLDAIVAKRKGEE